MPPRDSKVVLEGGWVHFECPSCGTGLTLRKPRFNVTPTSKGAAVTPKWGCGKCGLVGKVKHSDVVVIGRMSIPPSGAVLAEENVKPRAQAIRIRPPSEPSDFDPARLSNLQTADPKRCSNRRQHGYLARSQQKCPVCGQDWREREPVIEPEEDEAE